MKSSNYIDYDMLSDSTVGFQKATHKSIQIYILLVFAILAAIVAMPFINVKLVIRSTAIIRPVAEMSSVKSPVNGRLKQIPFHENDAIKKGDILFIIENDILHEREMFLNSRSSELQILIADIKLLVASDRNTDRPTSTFYKQALLNHRHKMIEAKTKFDKIKADWIRNRKLYDQQVISTAEFEMQQFEFDKAKEDMELQKQMQYSQWHVDLKGYQDELRSTTAELEQVRKEANNLIIRAPVSGTIQNLTGMYSGSNVFANQDLCQISPDTSLVVETYVQPGDMGLLRKGMPISVQVDAFHYNQWGVATGNILDISNDIYIIHDKPVFKVRCTLKNNFLRLKNGYTGYLKKGMTAQTHFQVTERTLWQLLYDKTDDWFNPNTSKKQD